ncbi:hypothetical protein CRM91_19060 [Burkholderia ambifaria]|nr:hypothetical protein CRM91_19060 [Burkholderia ambifaria]
MPVTFDRRARATPKQAKGCPAGGAMSMKPSRGSRGALAALLVAASVALSGCGVLGCGGVATNGAAGGGCSAGMRF